ncbi:hypothetical protein BJ085DRAFT_34022 [Dimargaris cristalligena]|uniref:Uncharacterized protein n=1 Tax=Dimargaris cristalligena TaxID=215637 RepID=A0A4P9ZN29_9FUNG|nr:hypothetical protein BJ085DRAFT_34022 [Dimargaris cristalligena]|eukprot:RKP34518.1 hypothetical protein BJ085DRAFT_34022 [Dimargaris cristalligena]
MAYNNTNLVSLCLLWILALGQGFGYPSSLQGSPAFIPTGSDSDLFDSNEFLGLSSASDIPPPDPLSPTSATLFDHFQFPTTEYAMATDSQIATNLVLGLDNASDIPPHESALDLAEYLNLDDTDHIQFVDPTSSPAPSISHQPIGPVNPSGDTILALIGDYNTAETSNETSGGLLAPPLGTLEQDSSEPTTYLDLLTLIELVRSKHSLVLPNPKRQKLDTVSSSATESQLESQIHTPDVVSPLTLSSTTILESGILSRDIDSKAEPVFISKAERERREINDIIGDPDYKFK